MSAAGLENQFDPIIVSDEVGLKKPDPRIFQLALDHADVDDALAAVYVGDNPTDDIGGAKAFGMSTIWYRRFRSEKSCPEADFTTDDLITIPDWLKS
jgi:FMN phosphatase YigB (HAD superfamily)